MFHNRISAFYQDWDVGQDRQVEEVLAPPSPSGFAVVPLAQLPLDAQQAIQRQQSLYQLAFAQAQAACNGES